tara:strand:+ start:365 stop:556 length:192 start_codon:yes stop_codon:yes gene_type:complete
MKIIDEKKGNFTQFRLGNVSIKEIMNKYPDKVVDVKSEGKNAVLILDTCRIKFVNAVNIKGGQ